MKLDFNMQTAESLMELLDQKVSNNEPLSPAYWCEMALRVNTLATNLDNQVATIESQLNKIEAEYIKKDFPANKAKVFAKSEVDYESYLKLKALIKRIENFLSTARKRSQINEF